jgi:hypothetical protein
MQNIGECPNLTSKQSYQLIILLVELVPVKDFRINETNLYVRIKFFFFSAIN